MKHLYLTRLLLSTLHSNRSRSPNLSSITKPLLPPPSSSHQQPTSLSIKNLPTNYPVNHQLNSSGSSILLSTGTNLEAVPRTHSSNKRLRKEDSATTLNQQQTKNSKESLGIPLRDDQSLFKKQRINGGNINKINLQVPSPSTPKVIHNNDDFKNSGGDNNNIVVAPAATDDGPKKRGCKKDRKVIKNQLKQNVGVSIKEKIQSMLRVSKCKTTREIMEDLKAARALSTETSLDYTLSNAKTKNEPPKTKEILCDSSLNDVKYNLSSQTTKTTTTTDRVSLKLTKSDDNNDKINNDCDGSKKNDSSSKNTTQFKHDPMVEKILAKLPPLDLNSINWSDNELDYHDDDQLPPPTDEEIDRLTEYSIECLNGNFQLTHDNLSNNVDKKIDKKDDGLTSCQTIKYPLYRKRNNQNNNSNNDDVGDDGNVDKFEFREWDQSLVRPTIDGRILHIKPYVIID
ncbi:hypothetical protein HCN44_000790 [Aphidius gifuensis]|uniref:Uncharacterized protein n=1 Tax=Aphidius gifuensis TaxID=684658 RepID=A0A834XSC9_APHGI|nr:hypothetical protein HCN44_000790 [Aphidius gifuensis]